MWTWKCVRAWVRHARARACMCAQHFHPGLKWIPTFFESEYHDQIWIGIRISAHKIHVDYSSEISAHQHYQWSILRQYPRTHDSHTRKRWHCRHQPAKKHIPEMERRLSVNPSTSQWQWHRSTCLADVSCVLYFMKTFISVDPWIFERVPLRIRIDPCFGGFLFTSTSATNLCVQLQVVQTARVPSTRQSSIIWKRKGNNKENEGKYCRNLKPSKKKNLSRSYGLHKTVQIPAWWLVLCHETVYCSNFRVLTDLIWLKLENLIVESIGQKLHWQSSGRTGQQWPFGLVCLNDRGTKQSVDNDGQPGAVKMVLWRHWSTWISCIQRCQGTNFTAPGCKKIVGMTDRSVKGADNYGKSVKSKDREPLLFFFLLSFSPTHSLSLTHTLSLTHFLSLSLSLSPRPPFTLPLSSTNAHTHTHIILTTTTHLHRCPTWACCHVPEKETKQPKTPHHKESILRLDLTVSEESEKKNTVFKSLCHMASKDEHKGNFTSFSLMMRASIETVDYVNKHLPLFLSYLQQKVSNCFERFVFITSRNNSIPNCLNVVKDADKINSGISPGEVSDSPWLWNWLTTTRILLWPKKLRQARNSWGAGTSFNHRISCDIDFDAMWARDTRIVQRVAPLSNRSRYRTIPNDQTVHLHRTNFSAVSIFFGGQGSVVFPAKWCSTV